MRNKALKILIFAAALSSLAAGSAFAGTGEWKQDSTGWWWQRSDGTFPKNEWRWIDADNDGTGECYHFDANGYLETSRWIGDDYVNADGVWVTEMGPVQIWEGFDEIGGNGPVHDDLSVPSDVYGKYTLQTETAEVKISIYQAVTGECYLHFSETGTHEDGTPANQQRIYTIQRLYADTYGGTEHTSYSDDIISFEWKQGWDHLENVTMSGYPVGNFEKK